MSAMPSAARKLSRLMALKVCQYFHVAVKTGGTTGELPAHRWLRFLWMLGQANQVAIGRAINPLRVWKRLGKIHLGEAEEFFLTEWLPIPHLFVRPIPSAPG